jgi:hypothetical protein
MVFAGLNLVFLAIGCNQRFFATYRQVNELSDVRNEIIV